MQDLAVRADFGVTGDEALAELAASVQLLAVVQAVYLNAVRGVAAHPEAVGRGLSGEQAVKSVLTQALRVSGPQAARDYAAAVATGESGPLPRLGRSLVAGVVHRSTWTSPRQRWTSCRRGWLVGSRRLVRWGGR